MVVDLGVVGQSGLTQWNGVIRDDDSSAALSGDRRFAIIREMVETDPTVGAVMFAIEMLIRRVAWAVEPPANAADPTLAEEVAAFIRSCLFDDLDVGWEDTLSEMLSFIPYGFAFFEVVYKRRLGESTDPDTPSSGYDDGRVGWSRWAPRAQETLYRWEFDRFGAPTAFVQLTPPLYAPTPIPLAKGLLFRTTARKGNPEGRPVVRTAHQPWYYKTRIQKIEAIGIERDLAGLPIAEVPAQYLSPTATPAERATVDEAAKIVQNTRRDAQEGIVWPQAYVDGKPMFSFRLLSTGGSRQFDTNAIIARYKADIAGAVLADFVLLGHAQVGTYNLAQVKSTLFTTALEAWLDIITSVINDQAIKPLVRLNGWDPAVAPSLTHAKVEAVDLGAVGTFLGQLSQAGVIGELDEDQRTFLLGLAGIPVPHEEEG